jgi:hypothetical protein
MMCNSYRYKCGVCRRVRRGGRADNKYRAIVPGSTNRDGKGQYISVKQGGNGVDAGDGIHDPEEWDS